MAYRRFVYLSVLASCGVFYIAYGEWLAFLVLMVVLTLPWFSLLLSLPAMLAFQAAPAGPTHLQMGENGNLWLMGSCGLPMPPFRGRLRLQRHFTGEKLFYQDELSALTNHCGAYTITAEKVRICDYLGLFSFPVTKKGRSRLIIRPRPLAVPMEEELDRKLALAWKPRPGGGFSEHHELRLYRPGDKLNQVHWKLTAKTGKMILREPMEPRNKQILLTMTLRGTDQELDRMLGRLLWLGDKFLDRELPFHLRVLTGEGLLAFFISDPERLQKTVDDLLCRSLAPEGEGETGEQSAFWQYHIGGQPDEA